MSSMADDKTWILAAPLYACFLVAGYAAGLLLLSYGPIWNEIGVIRYPGHAIEDPRVWIYALVFLSMIFGISTVVARQPAVAARVGGIELAPGAMGGRKSREPWFWGATSALLAGGTAAIFGAVVAGLTYAFETEAWYESYATGTPLSPPDFPRPAWGLWGATDGLLMIASAIALPILWHGTALRLRLRIDPDYGFRFCPRCGYPRCAPEMSQRCSECGTVATPLGKGTVAATLMAVLLGWAGFILAVHFMGPYAIRTLVGHG